ncbi:MAG: adenylate/guanylate cyclase domain-containing protein [Elusimicrobiales bacterium]|nr:adenylate/guanylate cyclase domain-containing protein [Elusimicrobiales bacterium]
MKNIILFGDPEKAARKEKMTEFFNLLTIPLFLAFVNSAFFRIAMVAFTGGQGGSDTNATLTNISLGARHTGVNIGTGFILMIVMVYIWGRPAYLYVRNPDEKLKAKIRVRLGNVYRDAFLMLVIAQGIALAVPGFTGRLSWQHYAAAGIAFLAQAALVIAQIDAHLSKQKKLIEALYAPEELFSLRSGFSIPLYVKVSSLIIGFAVIPFILIYILFLNRVPWDVFAADLGMMLFLSGVLLLGGLSSIYNGVQVPLDGLIAKMKRVAGGDFVKTRIYFSDEVAYLKAGFNEMVDGLKEREELQDTFGKYLSIEIARELIKNKKVNLGGEDMVAAVMFCDIRNFTPLSEKLSASELVDFLNNYFHYITPPITANKGVINKFMGDAVMAIYTPLLGSEDYAADAVRAAVGMRKALAELNASGKAPGVVDFGIGIHAGKLVGGNVGTAFRLEYTFIGDTVNIASRLESKTKELNTDIIVSGAALEMARGSLGNSVSFAPLGKVALKGKTETMELYKVV